MQKDDIVGSGTFATVYKIASGATSTLFGTTSGAESTLSPKATSEDTCTTCDSPLTSHVLKVNKLRDYYLLREIVIQLGVEGHPAVARICAVDSGPTIANLIQPNYGQTLHSVILGQVPPTDVSAAKYFAEMLGVVKDVLSGLNYLHTYGIVHGDLSPSNIMVQRAVSAPLVVGTNGVDTAPLVAFGDSVDSAPLIGAAQGVIIDFGCAKRLSGNAETTYVNIALYRPPEVFAATGDLCKYGAEVDLWAFGCCIMTLLGSYRTGETDLDLNYLFYNKDYGSNVMYMYRALYPDDCTMINKSNMQKKLCDADQTQPRLDNYLPVWLKKKSPMAFELITKDVAATELYSVARRCLMIDCAARCGHPESPSVAAAPFAPPNGAESALAPLVVSNSVDAAPLVVPNSVDKSLPVPLKAISGATPGPSTAQNDDPNNLAAVLAFKNNKLLEPALMASANRIFTHIRPKLTQVPDVAIKRASALVAAAIYSTDYHSFARKFVKGAKNTNEVFRDDTANDVRKCLSAIFKSNILKKEVTGDANIK